jgi:subtilase family serine protease
MRVFELLGGNMVTVDGTSASGPIMAGVVSLLNEARLNAGKTPLGLLNPMFYKVCGCCRQFRHASADWSPVV